MLTKEPWLIHGQLLDHAHRLVKMCTYLAVWASVVFLSLCKLGQQLSKTTVLSVRVQRLLKAVSSVKVPCWEWVFTSANQLRS